MAADPQRHLATGMLLVVAAVALSACNLQISLKAEARDKWQRQYTLARGGTLEIRNTNGVIHIEPSQGDKIEVTADRVVQAMTDQAAKDGLAGFEIQETVEPNHITIDATNRAGTNLTFNMSRRVEYHVRAPEWTNVKLATTNGDINVGPKLTGTFRAEATNGRIKAVGLENNANASTTNGTINLEVSKLGEDGISCETTNGMISLTVPPDLNARLSARVTNGAIKPEGLKLAISEQSRRRLDATIGNGGPPIRLETTNGAIQIQGR